MVVIQNHLVSILSTIIGPISVNDTNIRGPQEMTNDTSDCGIFHHTAASPTGQTFHLFSLVPPSGRSFCALSTRQTAGDDDQPAAASGSVWQRRCFGDFSLLNKCRSESVS